MSANASASNANANSKSNSAAAIPPPPPPPPKPANANSNSTNASNASNAQAANAAAAVVSNTTQETVEVSVGNKNYTCIIRKMGDKEQAATGEIVVTKNGQKYAVTVTEPSKRNGGRIKRVTRNQKKKKTRSTRK